MLGRILAITQKELIQTMRDRATLIILLTIPLVQLLLYATAIHTDVQHIPMVVADQSVSSESRLYLNALVDSNYFDIVSTVSSQDKVMDAIDSGQASLGIVIPPNFASQVKLNQAQVLMLVDGSDSFTTSSAYSTANSISQSYAINLIHEPVSPLNTSIRILYNPDLKDLWFLIPGLIASLLQTQTLALTALAVVRERETGTIEAILVTPIRPIELMLGKSIPNLFIAFCNMVSILIVGQLIFGVPFRGNLLLYIILCTVFALSGLALGLAISAGSQNQAQAQQLTQVVSFTGLFLSGFLFPQYALPLVLRAISYLSPLTYFIPISRGIFTKGIGLDALWGNVIALSITLVATIYIASRLFRERLD
ncbi:MAG: ABC transporter permease [Chloroflexota bacterium]